MAWKIHKCGCWSKNPSFSKSVQSDYLIEEIREHNGTGVLALWHGKDGRVGRWVLVTVIRGGRTLVHPPPSCTFFSGNENHPRTEEATSRSLSKAGRSKQCWQKESPGTSISGFNAHTYPPTKTCGLMSFSFFAITKRHIEEICWSRPWAATWMGKPNVNWVSLSSVFKSSLSCKEAPVQAHDLKHTTTPISSIL